MKIVFAEPRFHGVSGHWVNTLRGVGRAAHALGLDVEVHARRDIDEAAVAMVAEVGLPVHRTFHGARAPQLRVRLLTWPALSGAIAMDLVALRRRLGPGVPIVLASGDVEILTAAVAAARVGAGPLLVQLFFWETRRHENWPRPLFRALDRQLARAVGRQQGRGLLVVAQGEALSRSLSARVGAPVPALPYPVVDWTELPPPEPASPGRRPRVGYVGGARLDKGFPEFVEAVATLGDELEVVAQAHMPRDNRSDACARGVETLRARAGTDVLDEPLDVDAYYALFRSLDAVALPYDRVAYRERTSAILMEALGLGVTPIVPSGTWLAEAAADFGAGRTYDGGAEGLRAALRALATDGDWAIDARTADAVRDATRPDAFLARLVSLLRTLDGVQA